MNLRTVGVLATCAVALIPNLGSGQELPDWVKRTRISGLAFGDGYYALDHHDSAVADQRSGFWIRRAYLTLDNALGDGFSYRFRFEVNSPGDFKSSSALVPYVKDVWVRWLRSSQEIVVGISPTPTWEVVERFWGYRSVEKTPLDLQRFGDSRDFGVAALGRLGSKGVVRYHVMLANGAGTKSETDAGKKVMLSVGLYPTEEFVLEVYGDYEGRPNQNDRATVQGFAVLQGSWGRLGVQGVRQWRRVPGGQDATLEVASVFAVAKLRERVNMLARYDRTFDANPEADKIPYFGMSPAAKTNVVLAGLDLTVHQRFHLIPNVEAVLYSTTGTTRPSADVFGRVTFDVTF